jgi:hypothetical protein
VNIKFARWTLPSFKRTTSRRQLFDHALSVFHVWVYWPVLAS